MPVLEASGIRKQFGGVVALAGADFSLEAGEVHALIGSNGCGNSTLCKIIAGSVAADSGRVVLDGREVVFDGPHEAAEAGIGVFYQDLLIPQMTVAENIHLGANSPAWRAGGPRPAKSTTGAPAQFARAGSPIRARSSEIKVLAESRIVISTRPLRWTATRWRYCSGASAPGTRALDHLHHPPDGRSVRDRRPGHRHSQRPDGHDAGREADQPR
jgi:ribose transport system ATP-binding protein